MEPNYKIGHRTFIFAGLFILALWLCSCGSRKTSKSNTETKETTQTENTKIDTSKTVTVANSNSKIIDTGTEEEFTIVPIDSSKEMVVNSVKYKNARLSHKKVNNNKVAINSNNITTTAKKHVSEASKSNISKSVKAEIKNVDKKQFNILSLWWVILVLIVVYWVWKKYKGVMPF